MYRKNVKFQNLGWCCRPFVWRCSPMSIVAFDVYMLICSIEPKRIRGNSWVNALAPEIPEPDPPPTCLPQMCSIMTNSQCSIPSRFDPCSFVERYYSASIIQMSGVRDTQIVIWLAAVTALVNFLFTVVGVWLVERVGRRLLALISIAGTFAGCAVGSSRACFGSHRSA